MARPGLAPIESAGLAAFYRDRSALDAARRGRGRGAGRGSGGNELEEAWDGAGRAAARAAAKAAARAAEQVKKQQQDVVVAEGAAVPPPRAAEKIKESGCACNCCPQVRSGRTRQRLVHARGSRLRRRVQQRANLFRPGLAVRTRRRDGTWC